MKIIITKDYNSVSLEAGKIIADEVEKNPRAVLGLATGSSPIGIYRYLIACHKEGLSFASVTTANLDEYVGIPAEHNQSYRYFMKDNLFSHIDIKQENIHFPDGSATDLDAECARYSAFLSKTPRSIQLLGIGANGHIGFNEPGTPFDTETHTVDLKESTIRDNARFFSSENEVPRRAVTMGIKNILQAKRIILVATDTKKAQAIANMMKGDISPECPASALRLHDDVYIIIDKSAASLL